MRDLDRLLLAVSAAVLIAAGVVAGGLLYEPAEGRVDAQTWLESQFATPGDEFAWLW